MGDKPVTMDVVKTLLQSQAEAFKASFVLLIQDVKDEMKSIRNDINDLKASLQFSQAKLDEAEKSMAKIDQIVCAHGDNLNSMNEFADSTEDQLEYLENQSRRCNVRIIGLPEDKQQEKTWDDTEHVVKKALEETLKLEKNIDIERWHRVNHRQSGSSHNNEPRPIVAKIASWKDKEIILMKARELKPKGVKFLPDLSSRTIQKRKEKVPDLLAARKAGKIAYFILDRLVIKEKPPGNWKSNEGSNGHKEVQQGRNSDSEVSFNEQ